MILDIFSNLAGSIINAILVLIGSLIGILFKNRLPERYSKVIMSGLGLCVVYIGISGTLKGSHTLILVLSTVIGIIIGELLKLDQKIDKLGLFVQSKFTKQNDGKNTFAEGFVTASLMFCVGSMTVLGAFESALGSGFARHTTQIVKGVLDLVSSMVFASQLGIGVAFSAVFVFVFQGLLTVAATLLGSFLSTVMIAEMTCAGSIILIGTGLNMIGITKIKTVNFVPAIFIAPLLTYLAELAGILQYV